MTGAPRRAGNASRSPSASAPDGSSRHDRLQAVRVRAPGSRPRRPPAARRRRGWRRRAWPRRERCRPSGGRARRRPRCPRRQHGGTTAPRARRTAPSPARARPRRARPAGRPRSRAAQRPCRAAVRSGERRGAEPFEHAVPAFEGVAMASEVNDVEITASASTPGVRTSIRRPSQGRSRRPPRRRR